MIPKDLFAKVRRIEITTSRLVSDVFAGQYHSVFKGQGIEFEEVREYQHGDDVRTIDWNVTARTGRAHVKKFVEERELTVMILVDASRSCRFASVNMLKSQLAAEVSALLALSAIRNNDKVGLIIFTDIIEKFIAPAKGRRHVLRLVREVLYFEPKGRKTDIAQALQYLDRVTTRKTIGFLISDFFEDEPGKTEAVKTAMAIAHRRHDLIPITLNDPRERFLPDCGLVSLEDAETEETVLVDSSNKAVREAYEKMNLDRIRLRERLFRSIGMDFIDISTQAPYADSMIKFFKKRSRR
ncbi:MAG TPA: DUF58 domain-containing protein [Candidatus Omnitrophota bacterium]|nr:DUF58 domain-containing protein [Candidatus Omnitrophota bacterium]